MTLTVAYSFQQMLDLSLPTHNGDINDLANNSDVVGLAGGGFATVADNSDGLSDVTIYTAAGGIAGSPGVLALSDSKIMQEGDGNLFIAGNHGGGGIDYVEITPTGGPNRSGALSSDTRDSNADVSGLTGGEATQNNAFVVVYQRANGATDHDIEVYAFHPVITNVVAQFAIDPVNATNDQNPSVAGLADGGYAVVWERIDSSGHSTAWEAIYNADSTVRLTPHIFDIFGTVNHQMSVTALPSGGFSVGYEDNFTNSNNGQSDITVLSFSANGTPLGTSYSQASTTSSDDSQAALTTLSNGLVLSTFSNAYDPGHGPDSQILASLIDPATGLVLTDPANPQPLDSGDDQDTESSVSALALAQFVISYSTAQTSEVREKTFQLVRTATGDSADDTFTGDDAVDIVSGGGGNDNLAGGANKDTLNGGDGIDLLNGGAGNDVVIGGANNDFLFGGDGNDTLKGGTGPDAMLGGLGNDRFYVDNVSDEVSEAAGGGSDRVFTSVSYFLQAGQEFEALSTTSNPGTVAINLTGNEFGQQLIGNAGSNVLRGNGGNDALTGGAGFDRLIGGGGLDKLNGGAGNDAFVYSALSDSGLTSKTRDQITGFASGDKIDVHLIDAVAGGADNAFVLDAGGTFAAGEIHQTLTPGGDLRLDFNADADTTPEMSILLLNRATLLTSGDFVL